MAVTLYRQVGKGKARRYQKINLGRGRRSAGLIGPYFLRYSLADGTRPWEHVGDDLDEAIAARERKQAYFEALDANVPVVQDQDETGRTKITDAVYQWFAELQLFQGKDQQGKSEKTLRAYNYRLGFFLDFTAQQNLRYLDQIDRKQLLRYVKFLRDHESDLDDRTVHNIFETLNTFLRTRDMFIAGKILAELDYAEKPPKPYTKQELKDLFAAMDEEEKLLYGLFLNSGMRDAEMQNTEYADFNWEKGTLHVQPKPWRKFRLKGKSKKKSAKDRFIPIPAKLVWKIKDRMRERNAQPHDLVTRYRLVPASDLALHSRSYKPFYAVLQYPVAHTNVAHRAPRNFVSYLPLGKTISEDSPLRNKLTNLLPQTIVRRWAAQDRRPDFHGQRRALPPPPPSLLPIPPT
jgi:integrase